MKKASLALSTLIMAIIVLSVLGIGTKVIWDLTSKPMNRLFGFSNISAFDDDIVERFNLTKEINKDAVDSVNGLLYAINSLAYIDTYDQEKLKAEKFDYMDKGKYKEYEENFDKVSVKPTYYDRETIFVPAESTLEKGIRELAIGTISCWLLHGDKDNENTRCYSITFEEGYKHLSELDALDEESFMNWMIEQKQDICVHYSGRFKAVPIETCVDVIEEITGDTWNPFNVNNIEWDELPKKHFSSREGKEVSICANNDGLNEIFFHQDSKGDVCEAPTNAFAFGYKVKGFSLPQRIEKSPNPLVYAIEDWLYAYGDPEYVLFYEKFPEGEAQYWEMSEYQIAWRAILITEAAFLGIDLLTWGMGSGFTNYLKEPLKKLGTKVTRFIPFKNMMKGTLKASSTKIKKIVGWSIEKIIRKGAPRATLEESAEKIIRVSFKKDLKKGVYNSLDDDTFVFLKKKCLEALNSLGEEAFDKSGKLTKKGLTNLDSSFKKVLEGTSMDSIKDKVILNGLKSTLGKEYDDVIYRVGKELGEKAQEASFRSIPRALIRAEKVAHRAKNMLRIIFVGDMTDEARERTLINMLKESDKALSHMKPIEKRAFMANQQKAIDLIMNKETGELILKGTGEEFSDAAQRKARDKIYKILKGVDLEEIMPKTYKLTGSFFKPKPESVLASQREAGKIIDNLILRKRHIVVATVAYMAARAESMAAKNYPVGTNVIGLKTPYKHTVPFEEFETGVSYNDINQFIGNKQNQDTELKGRIENHQKIAQEKLEKYGQPGYQGLLPEVGRYYLSLTKDMGIFDQDPQRFHLVSPCETDILIEISTCECWGEPELEAGIYETGGPYELMDIDDEGNSIPMGEIINNPHFDGDNKMLYRIDNLHRPIKECFPDGFFGRDTLIPNPSYRPKCIKINPLMDNFDNNNYCYHGISDSDEILGYTATAAHIGIAVVGGIICNAPCAIGFGAVAGVLTEIGRDYIRVKSQWPNHD